jgi:hypothetical protein
MAAGFVKAVEINVDSSHVYFVHPKHPATLARMAQRDRLPTPGEVRTNPSGLVTFWPATTREDEAPPGTAEMITFNLPNRVTIEGPGGMNGLVVDLFFVPIGEHECRMEYLVSQPQIPGHSVRWLDTTPDVFSEDKAVLEALEKVGGEGGDFVEKNVPADTAPLLARRMIHALRDGTLETVLEELPKRVVFTL